MDNFINNLFLNNANLNNMNTSIVLNMNNAGLNMNNAELNANLNNNINIGDILKEVQLTPDFIKKNEIKKCIICLEDFKINNKVSFLPCSHLFHSSCIKHWLEKSRKCPICINEVKFE